MSSLSKADAGWEFVDIYTEVVSRCIGTGTASPYSSDDNANIPKAMVRGCGLTVICEDDTQMEKME